MWAVFYDTHCARIGRGSLWGRTTTASWPCNGARISIYWKNGLKYHTFSAADSRVEKVKRVTKAGHLKLSSRSIKITGGVSHSSFQHTATADIEPSERHHKPTGLLSTTSFFQHLTTLSVYKSFELLGNWYYVADLPTDSRKFYPVQPATSACQKRSYCITVLCINGLAKAATD
jgi:hypothetical protein